MFSTQRTEQRTAQQDLTDFLHISVVLVTTAQCNAQPDLTIIYSSVQSCSVLCSALHRQILQFSSIYCCVVKYSRAHCIEIFNSFLQLSVELVSTQSTAQCTVQQEFKSFYSSVQVVRNRAALCIARLNSFYTSVQCCEVQGSALYRKIKTVFYCFVLCCSVQYGVELVRGKIKQVSTV